MAVAVAVAVQVELGAVRSSDTAYEPQGGGFAHLGDPSTPRSAPASSGGRPAGSGSRGDDGGRAPADAGASYRHLGLGDGVVSRPRPASAPSAASDPARAVFERQLRLARRALRVPLVRLTLLGDTPAAFTSVDPALHEVGAGAESSAWRSFCERAARTLDVLCVADTRRSERRGHAPRGSGLRAYAGVPVTAHDGRILGSFCVGDRHPREWSADDIETLRDLAAAAGAQLALRTAMLQAQRLARADAESAQSRLAFLAEASIVLASSLDYTATLNKLATLAVPLLGDWCAIDLLTEAGAIERLAAAHSDPDKMRLVREGRASHSVDPAGPHPVAEVLRTGRPKLLSHIGDDLLRAIYANPATLDLARGLGLRSAMIVPLIAHGRVLGAITLATSESSRRYSADALALAEELARRAAVTVDNARLYQRTQTALRQVEAIAAELGQKAAELDTIIEAIPDGVYVCDASGIRTRVNAHGAALLGLPPEQALGPIDRFAETNKPHDPDGTPLPIAELPLLRALRGETRTDIRFAITQAGSGNEVQLLACCAPIRDTTGAITGAVTVCTDITELTRLERQKDDFLSVASHEMKTPLTSLKILTQLTHRRLQRAGLFETQHIARMERSIQRMELLVNDLLDSSRIESGRLALRIERCDLVPICRQVADEQMAASDRPVKLDLPDEPVEVEVDPERIGQVLTNLLSNALKYSPPSCPVMLTLRANREHGHAELSVRDEGTGIPPESLPHLFERFYRVPGVQVQSGSGVGLGLGLYITKEIVQRHGGAIHVTSAVGAGTTFTATLPFLLDR